MENEAAGRKKGHGEKLKGKKRADAVQRAAGDSRTTATAAEEPQLAGNSSRARKVPSTSCSLSRISL
ncbi:MAG: hypothetical protein RBR77_03785, partial [Thauera sp.]|nr:hypothetical protein [Thauera sp.]